MKPVKHRTRRQRITFYLFGWLTRIVFFLLFSTCRVQVIGREIEESFTRDNPGKGLLYASWHRGLMYFIYFYRFRQFVVMASASKDGELATQTVIRHGWIPIRGSSSYRGSEALREMIPYFKKGHRGGLVVDAPQGPPHVSKVGIIIMARMTGLLIVPVMWSADRYWRLKSWDRTIIPKPFSRIVFFYPERLFTVPRKASKEECEQYRQQLDDCLNRMMYQTDHYFQTPGITSPAEIEVPDAALKDNPGVAIPNLAK